MKDYIKINKASWNAKLETHLESDFYDLDGFLGGKSSLNDIELSLLGDVKNKRILHLQCHFGQDTISLARLGASVTGVDLSDSAIEKAKELAIETGADVDVKFICCNIYDLPQYLDANFDIVFASYGTIAWLPDLGKWAEIIQHFLMPSGKFVFVEFHPVVWMYDDDFENIIYNYNNTEAIVEEEEEGTYADKNAPIKQTCITWNHGLGEVINSLISSGLRLDSLEEYNYAPYPFVQDCEEIGHNKYQVEKFGDKIPLVYSIIATNNKKTNEKQENNKCRDTGL